MYLKLTLFVVFMGVSFIYLYPDVPDEVEDVARIIKNVSYPLVMWHGMGDCCCNSFFGMKSLESIIKRHIPGLYIHSLMIGYTFIDDIFNGFIKNVNNQVQMACDIIASDPNLKDGYNAMGFSQGGQFLRAVAQRCPNPPMKNLISIGGQHQGVFGLPHCSGDDYSFCNSTRQYITSAAYFSLIQNHIVQTQYWHDPLQEDRYKQTNIFLADINQERWFGFYEPGQTKVILPLSKTELYKMDKLGLQEMDNRGKLHFLSYDSDHLQFDDGWFIGEIILKFL